MVVEEWAWCLYGLVVEEGLARSLYWLELELEQWQQLVQDGLVGALMLPAKGLACP